MVGTDADRITVLIVDDHPVVRNGLRAALESAAGITVVGEARNGREAEEQALSLKPRVIIMDLYMPGQGGLPTLHKLKAQLPDTRFLMMSISELEKDRLEAIRYGADNFIHKSIDVADLVDAIRGVARAPHAAVKHANPSANDGIEHGSSPRPVLTSREEEVFSLLGEGLTNTEIASRLFVSTSTVNTYVYRLLLKLGLKNRGEAIVQAARWRAERPGI